LNFDSAAIAATDYFAPAAGSVDFGSVVDYFFADPCAAAVVFLITTAFSSETRN
jgi:hypothetical protein